MFSNNFVCSDGNIITAKGAGDIVILDDSFMAIAKTILYGRTIFKSIRKFITFQLIMNMTACGVSLVGQFMGIDSPITIIQMLWINIIMDTLGGLAFAGEAAEERIMREKPKQRDEEILSPYMKSRILGERLSEYTAEGIILNDGDPVRLDLECVRPTMEDLMYYIKQGVVKKGMV